MKRFDESIIEASWKYSWWNWENDYILKNIQLLLNHNPSLLIKKFKSDKI